MSSTKFASMSKGTVTRENDDGSSGQGCGGSKRLYVGRRGTSGRRNFDSYLRPDLTGFWTDVGKIVSATLIVYTDDFNGLIPAPSSTDTPKIIIRRVSDAAGFEGGNNDDGDFDSSDYTNPTTTTSGAVSKFMSKAANAVNRINVTSIVEGWAPSTVKRRDGRPGGGASNHGFALLGYIDTDLDWSGWSEDADDPGMQPQLELVYELGPTVPNTPTNLSPSGSVASLTTFQGDFSDVRATDTLFSTSVQVWRGSVTAPEDEDPIWSRFAVRASASEITADRSAVDPIDFTPVAGRTYKWRMRHVDQEGQASAWTALTSVTFTNTVPNDPVFLTPAASAHVDLSEVFVSASYSDANGDDLLAYQVQMSVYPEGDAHWLDADSLIWDTGLRQVSEAAASWGTRYTGGDAVAGTYYLRIRHQDERGGLSGWEYREIITDADFDAVGVEPTIQVAPHAPWRIVIRAMHSNGNRGPGTIVAVLEDAKSVGATKMYNSPGEAHWTLGKDHPQAGVIEPKQTHYSIQFYSRAGWKEKYAGLVWDVDATETDVVYTGIDYLALFDLVQDERYDPADPDKASSKGGSKFVDREIDDIVNGQLLRAIGKANSPVGFISVGTIEAMTERVSIYSTMTNTLSFVTGLIDSHRQGKGKNTRIEVVRTTAGGYEVKVTDNPGQQRDNLRLRYGELVNGYRIIPFGADWAQHVNVIGRARDGVKVYYRGGTSGDAPGISAATWGRIGTTQIMDGVTDENDLIRRQRQAAIHAGKLGKNMGLAIRTGFLAPLSGYDVTDIFPIEIVDGVIDTGNFGSGLWVCYGVAWEASDIGQSNVVLTLMPKEDTVSPDADLLTSSEISPQAEWQIGWTPPDALSASSRYWLDQSTGIVYEREDSGTEIELVPVTAGTTIEATAHGFSAGDVVQVGNLVGGTGLDDTTRYYVLAAGLTADELQLSLTDGGAAVAFTDDITEGTIIAAGVYTAIAPGEVMEPPPTLDQPAIGTIDTSVTDGVIRVLVLTGEAADPAAHPTIRTTEFRLSHELIDPMVPDDPDWTNAEVIAAAYGIEQAIFKGLPSTEYFGSYRYTDVYGNTSPWSNHDSLTTPAGYDSIQANNVLNGPAEVTIDDNGITIENGALTFLDDYGSLAMDGGGFGGTWQRFLATGLFNGDFFAEPPTLSAQISAVTNPVPWWDFIFVGGTISACRMWMVDDASTASGHALRFALTGGGDAADESYLEQIIPISGNAGQSFAYHMATTYKITSGISAVNAQLYMKVQHLTKDGVTTTGSEATYSVTMGGATDVLLDLTSYDNTTVPPADAYYARIRLGFKRNTALTSQSCEVFVYEVRVQRAPQVLAVADSDASESPAVLSKDSGFLGLKVSPDGSNGGSLFLSATDGRAGTGKIYTPTELEIDGIFRADDLVKFGGTSFPTDDLLTNDQYYRTDHGMWFFYNGTRWLSTQKFHLTPFLQRTTFPINASAAASMWFPLPILEGTDIWLEDFSVQFVVNSGGTALGGSHHWAFALQKLQNNSATETGITTITINSGSSGVHRASTATIDALLNNGTVHTGCHVDITRTGTPGDLYPSALLTYRLVAT